MQLREVGVATRDQGAHAQFLPQRQRLPQRILGARQLIGRGPQRGLAEQLQRPCFDDAVIELARKREGLAGGPRGVLVLLAAPVTFSRILRASSRGSIWK